MKSRVINRTWYGDQCERIMMEWLSNLEKCFILLNVKIKTYLHKFSYAKEEKRCKLFVRYR